MKLRTRIYLGLGSTKSPVPSHSWVIWEIFHKRQHCLHRVIKHLVCRPELTIPQLRKSGEELLLYVDREPVEPLPGAPDAVIRLRFPLPGGDPLWRQLRLAVRLMSDPPDVLFCPFYSAPLMTRVPRVVTVHYVAFLAHPEWFGLRGRVAGLRHVDT